MFLKEEAFQDILLKERKKADGEMLTHQIWIGSGEIR